MNYDDLLDLIAKHRDQHCVQASEWQRILEYRSQTADTRGVSEASAMIEKNSFAALTLSQLLRKAQQRGYGVELIYPPIDDRPGSSVSVPLHATEAMIEAHQGACAGDADEAGPDRIRECWRLMIEASRT